MSNKKTTQAKDVPDMAVFGGKPRYRRAAEDGLIRKGLASGARR
jgi:hypothetical protein